MFLLELDSLEWVREESQMSSRKTHHMDKVAKFVGVFVRGGGGGLKPPAPHPAQSLQIR